MCLEDCEFMVIKRSVFRQVICNLSRVELVKELEFLRNFDYFSSITEEKTMLAFCMLLQHIELENGDH